jgi:hypothetical protein
MNKYGVILDHFGFEKCLTDVVKNIVQPLTRLIYKHVTLPLDSHHGFVVEYAMDKYENSFIVYDFILYLYIYI